MDVAVVYESMFGMTHDVADAVAEGVATALPGARVVCLRVGDATPERLGTPDLLIVGGPTHMRGMSSSMSRKIAVSMEEKAARGEGEHQGHGLEPDVEGPGLRTWFHALPTGGQGPLRRGLRHPRVTAGPSSASAARGIQHRLAAARLPGRGQAGGLRRRGGRRPAACRGARSRPHVGRGHHPPRRGPGCLVQLTPMPASGRVT